MGTPKVSVIIPVYNEEKYLYDCIASIQNQSLGDIEIICIDDGSTDDSITILKELQKKDNRISVYSQKNKYAGEARNVGLKYAKGKYLLFLDADDTFEPNMFEKMYLRAEKENLDVVICEYEYIGSRKINFDFERSLLPENEVFAPSMIKDCAIFQLVTGVAWNKLFRKSFIDDLGITYQNLCCSNDGYFVYIAILCAKKLSYVKKSFVNYRIGNVFSISENREKAWGCAFDMLSAIKEKMIELNIYYIYEKSFLNYALTHSIGYLGSIHTIDNFNECYNYIRQNEKDNFHIIEKKDDYFYDMNKFGCYKEICEKTIDYFLQNSTYGKQIISPIIQFWSNDYRYNSRIIIYGAGIVGTRLYNSLKQKNYFSKIIWMDKQFSEFQKRGLEVIDPSTIVNLQVDYIYVAIKNKDVVNNVLAWLDQLNLKNVQIYHL